MSKPPRAERRKAARDARKLARARMRLASLEAGGGAGRAPPGGRAAGGGRHRARAPCAPRGAVAVRVEEHAAEQGQRIARVVCTQCGMRRAIWYRLGSTLPS